MAKQITLRNVQPELARRLEQAARDSGTSVNAKAIQILEQAVGIDSSARRTRLQRYTTWTDTDLRQMEESLAAQRLVDPKLWS
ncbi:MAG TPA: hypothetical protein VMT03_10560 [Polyangia bacterium]|nr:hypothetical protein [Polyangia bacterium]